MFVIGLDFGTLSVRMLLGETAVVALTPSPSRIIQPNSAHLEPYSGLYAEYLRLVSFFGRDANSTLKRLRTQRPN